MSEIKIYGTLSPGTTNNNLIASDNVFDKNQNITQGEFNKLIKNKLDNINVDIPNSSVNKYIHTQSEKSTMWNITHNLNSICVVQIYDDNGNQVIGEINNVDNNKIIIYFTIPIKGKAIII